MNQNPFIRVAEPLAMNASVNPLDVLKMKSALGVLGHYEAPEWGVTQFPDSALYSAIQSFQRGQRLTVDGVMKPSGQTEDALRNVLTAQQSDTALHTTAMALQGMGRNGDAILAHITPQEAQLLHRVTDGASINPATGLLEFWYDYEADAAGVGDTADNTGPDRKDDKDNGNGSNLNKGGQGTQASATTPSNTPETPPTSATEPNQTLEQKRPVSVPDDDLSYTQHFLDTKEEKARKQAEELADIEAAGATQNAPKQPQDFLSDPIDRINEFYVDATAWHFEDRSLLNSPLPKNKAQAEKMGFNPYPDWQAIEHQNKEGKPEKKFAHPDGREVIFDGDTGKVISDPELEGSYNYVTPPPFDQNNWRADELSDFVSYGLLHGVYDYLPFKFGGNRRGDG